MRKLIAIHLISVVCLAVFAIFGAIDISNSSQTGDIRIDTNKFHCCKTNEEVVN